MHLTTEAALDFAEGRLNKEEEAFWKKHMEICSDCARNVQEWTQLRMDLRRTDLVSAPERDLQNVYEILEPGTGGEPAAHRSTLATIVFDSFLQPALAGARGGSGTASRQLVMRAEEFDIHLKIWGDQNHRQLMGQLLPRKVTGFVSAARFHLMRNGERLESTGTDEMGEFHFTDLPEGALSLQIDLPNLTVIGSLNVGENS
jgi:hypothetical protein